MALVQRVIQTLQMTITPSRTPHARKWRTRCVSIVARASLLATISWAPCASAQMLDSLAGTTLEYYPSARAGGPTKQLAVGVFRAHGAIPVMLGASTIFLPGVSYERVELDGRGLASPAPTLHAPMLNLTLVQKVSDRLSLVLSLGYGIASDFGGPLGKDDFVVTNMVLGVYKLSDSVSLGGGILYDRRTGSVGPLPVVPINWRISENARLRGVIPASVAIEYRAAPWLAVGIRGAYDGNRYHLSENSYGVAHMQLAYSAISVGPKMTAYLADFVNVDVYLGVPVYRRYAAYVDGDQIASEQLTPVVGGGIRVWIGDSKWDSPR